MVAPTPAKDRVYEPKGGCVDIIECRDSEVLAEGPAGTGKTTARLWKLRLLCEKYPGSRHWIGRETRASMTDSVLVTLEGKVLGPEHPAVFNGPSRETRREYRFPNGSAIIVGGLDKPERTFSAEYDTVSVFEGIETQEGDVELLKRALRHGVMPYQQLYVDTNPGAPTHWLNRRPETGKMTRILTRHEDNPMLWDGDRREWTTAGRNYIANLDDLTGHRKERLRYGRWVAAEGVVYTEFDARVHIIDRMPDGWQGWPKYRAIDFGFVDPFVCQWWAVCDGALFMYREIYMSGKVVEDHARDIVRLSEGEEYVATVADHDREDRETLDRHGVHTIPARKELLRGIDALKARLRIGGNGKPRIYYLKNCTVESDRELLHAKRPTSTVAEYDCYIWKKHTDGVTKDQPVDRDNHGMDASRYMVMELDGDGPVGMTLIDGTGHREPNDDQHPVVAGAQAEAGTNEWAAARERDWNFGFAQEDE